MATMTAYYGKRKRGGTYGPLKRARGAPYVTNVPRAPPSNISMRDSSINKAFSVTQNFQMTPTQEVQQWPFTPNNVFTDEQKGLLNAFGQVKVQYVVVELLNLWAGPVDDTDKAAFSSGITGLGVADGRDVGDSLTSLVSRCPNTRTLPQGAMTFTKTNTKVMYKPVVDSERTWMTLATFMDAAKVFFNTCVANTSTTETRSGTLRFTIKLSCMMA